MHSVFKNVITMSCPMMNFDSPPYSVDLKKLYLFNIFISLFSNFLWLLNVHACELYIC